MKIQYLSTFMSVLKTGSFSAAAKELEISQGTVSNHVSALEEELDARIFKRTTKGVELTEAGKILQESSEKIFQEIEKIKESISATKSGFHGEIKIVASTIPGEHIIPSLISEFQSEYPSVKSKIKVANSMTSLQSLENDETDFAMVGSIRGYEERLKLIEIAKEELVLVVPNSHELARKKSVRLSEILSYPFVYREIDSGTRRETEKMLNAQGISSSDIKVVLELGSTESVITAVSEGRGISIISSIASKKAEAAGLVRTLRIEDAETTRKFYIARQKRKLSKASETFWEFCQHFKFKNKLTVAFRTL
jgi:DNA-binding transcriptional LysR family regulator